MILIRTFQIGWRPLVVCVRACLTVCIFGNGYLKTRNDILGVFNIIKLDGIIIRRLHHIVWGCCRFGETNRMLGDCRVDCCTGQKQGWTHVMQCMGTSNTDVSKINKRIRTIFAKERILYLWATKNPCLAKRFWTFSVKMKHFSGKHLCGFNNPVSNFKHRSHFFGTYVSKNRRQVTTFLRKMGLFVSYVVQLVMRCYAKH